MKETPALIKNSTLWNNIGALELDTQLIAVSTCLTV